jgi:hypothetical protein
VRNIIKSVLNEIYQKQNKPNLIKECTIAAVRIDDGVVLAKNRDRGYKARVEIIHELIDDVEIVYWRDIDTDWSEGMNEFGIGILNSSLLVAQDEKEGREVDKKRLKNDKTETKINSYDGEKIRKALTYKTLPKVIKSIISFRGGDQKDVGVKGETIVSDNRNIYVVELTSKHSPIIKKLNQDSKLVVRTNHGIYQKGAGYTRGEKRKSSLIRMELAKNHLKNVKKDLDVINVMKKKYNKDPF